MAIACALEVVARGVRGGLPTPGVPPLDLPLSPFTYSGQRPTGPDVSSLSLHTMPRPLLEKSPLTSSTSRDQILHICHS